MGVALSKTRKKSPTTLDRPKRFVARATGSSGGGPHLPSQANLENLRMSREEIDRAAYDFRTGTLIEPDDVYIYGHLSGLGWVIMFPEVDIKSRWCSECSDTFQSGFLYSDELKILSRCHHENILTFIGYCDDKDVFLQQDAHGDKVILVYEGVNDHNETLAGYLQNKDKLHHSWAERLKICIGVAKGLNYLHSGVDGVGRVIHNHMRSKNIMLDCYNLEPKILGFYLSVIVPENKLHGQINFDVQPEDNPDPVYHEIGLVDTTTDVYSYGIVMFELLIGMVAHEEMVMGDYKPQRLINIVRRCYDRPEQLIDLQLRDHIEPRSFHMFIDIAYRCISFNLKDRPTMDEVSKTIKEALDIHNQRAPCRIAKLSLEHQKRFHIPLGEINKATNYFQEPTEIGDSSSFYRGYLYHCWKKGPVAIKKCKA